jgi:hypothetical protein
MEDGEPNMEDGFLSQLGLYRENERNMVGLSEEKAFQTPNMCWVSLLSNR